MAQHVPARGLAGLRVEEGLVIQLCTEGLGGEQVQKVWDQLVESVTQ